MTSGPADDASGAGAATSRLHAGAPSLRSLADRDVPMERNDDFEDAWRGFLGTIDDAEIRRADGSVAWTMRDYAFLEAEEPAPTVHRNLWRQARLNLIHGLFEVVPRIYQVRGFDVANITFIEGDTGLIALDALSCSETAAAALALYRRHRDPEGRRAVHTVMYSHSHADHFAGVLGLVDPADVDAGRVRIVAPAGFMHEAVAENVIAGVAMGRRAQFQMGYTLPRGPEGQVDAGIGKTLPVGTMGLIAPTTIVERPIETQVIDGVEIVFQLALGSEAPAEMHFYFPGLRALDMAENTNHTMHNLCPLRGAEVRDALAWSKYLNAALHRFAGKVDVLLAQHHWPTWGAENVRTFLAEQRDLYRVLHDQTVRMMSHGLKPAEIAEALELPSGLARRWHARGFYGTVSHNVKAVYQKYLSWYDAHPANLNALPPVKAAMKTVEYMGGIDALMARARADLDRGEYRWVAEVMKHAVYAHPDHLEARALAADAMEQLGFRAESATWRNAYLLAAREYRTGPPATRRPLGFAFIKAVTLAQLFDSMAVRLNAPRIDAMAFSMCWRFTDSNETWLVELSNGALHAGRREDGAPAADVTLALDRSTFEQLLLRRIDLLNAIRLGSLTITGDPTLPSALFGALDQFSPSFPVVDAATLPS